MLDPRRPFEPHASGRGGGSAIATLALALPTAAAAAVAVLIAGGGILVAFLAYSLAGSATLLAAAALLASPFPAAVQSLRARLLASERAPTPSIGR
jgi:hypothetical protein